MLKVYMEDGTLIASTDEYAVAALVVSTFGADGGTVRNARNGQVLWREGVDGVAAESYDSFADFVEDKLLFLPQN